MNKLMEKDLNDAVDICSTALNVFKNHNYLFNSNNQTLLKMHINSKPKKLFF